MRNAKAQAELPFQIWAMEPGKNKIIEVIGGFPFRQDAERYVEWVREKGWWLSATLRIVETSYQINMLELPIG